MAPVPGCVPQEASLEIWRSVCKRLTGEWSWYQDLGLGRKRSRAVQKEKLGFPAVRERPG